jgi:hypothetical protein
MSNLDDLKNRNRIPITDHLWVYEDDPSMLLLDIDNKTLSVRFTPNSKLVNILSDEEKEKLAWYRKFLTAFEKGERDFNWCVSGILRLFPKLADVEGNYISNESLEKHGKVKKMEEKNEEKQIETKQAIVQKPKTEMKIGKPERMAMLYKIPSELAETRSVNRALRLFTGYVGTSYEEMPQGEIVEGDTN